MKLTYDRLHEVLDYDPDSGEFVWRERLNKNGRRNRFSNTVAGTLGSEGYIHIRIDGKIYKAHRLAWLSVYGYFPEYQIDHINQIRNDNEIKNLREVTRFCNMQNQKVNINNASGVTGVTWNKQRNKWRAHIRKNKKFIHLGRFSNLLDAAKVRYAAEQKYFTCVIESSAKKYIEENEKND